MTSDPAALYRAQLDARRTALAQEEGRDVALSWRRGGIVLAGIVAWLAALPMVTVALAVAFAVLVIVHERQARAVARAQRRVAFYETALARMNGDWIGQGEPGIGLSRSPAAPAAGSDASRPCVYGWVGRSKMSCTSPRSTLRPAYITCTRSAMRATTPRSWVMKTTPARKLCWILWITSRI